MTYHRIYNKNNTMGATCWAGTVYPSGTPEFTPDFSGVCLSVLFLLTIVLYVLWFTASDYPLLSSLFSYLRICMSLLFSFNHCINCPSMYGFWLPFWYLQTFNICGSVFVLFLLAIALSVLRFTTSDIPFGIFKLSSKYIRPWRVPIICHLSHILWEDDYA